MMLLFAHTDASGHAGAFVADADAGVVGHAGVFYAGGHPDADTGADADVGIWVRDLCSIL